VSFLIVKNLSLVMKFKGYLIAGFSGGLISSVFIIFFLMYHPIPLAGGNSAFLYINGSRIHVSGLSDKNVNLYIINGQDMRNEIIPKIFKETLPSVVHIISTIKNTSIHPFPINSSGSGIILTSNGYILTNNHVIISPTKPTVVLYNGKEYKANLIGRDPITDIAIIKIPATNLKPAHLGNSSKIQVGVTAIAIGNPFRFTDTLTVGVISALNRSFSTNGGYVIHDAIQTDAAINPGNSGGPLLNLKGEVIGVNTAIFSTTAAFEGIGLAIPINNAEKVAQDIIKIGRVPRAWMGITGEDFTHKLDENVSVKTGALVVSVDPRGPSYGILRGNKGIFGKKNFTLGDIIVGIDGRKISDMDDVIQAVLSHKIGNKIKVKFLREGKLYVAEITLGERPKNL